MPEIVNVVAAGELGREIDISAVAEDIAAAEVKLSDESYSNNALV